MLITIRTGSAVAVSVEAQFQRQGRRVMASGMSADDMKFRPVLQDPGLEARVMAQLDDVTRNDIRRALAVENAKGEFAGAMVLAHKALMAAYFALYPIGFGDKGVSRGKIRDLANSIDVLLLELLDMMRGAAE